MTFIENHSDEPEFLFDEAPRVASLVERFRRI